MIYFGPSKEYLVQLRLLRPILEKKFVDLNIHFCCKDDDINLLGKEKTLTMSQLSVKRNKFAHVYEFFTNNQVHPIEEMLKECEITEYETNTPDIEQSNKCVIVSEGNYPTKNLNKAQINKLKNKATASGYEVGEGLEGAGWVIGVESTELFEAAGKGIKTTLVETGVGTNLYEKMFPKGETIKI